LIEYLEELHEHHKATVDHTTLLLNCYAKLKDIDKLEKFIKSPGDLKFDLDTAISMCRQGGYYDQAAYLATKHDEHELVVDILIEDSKKYVEALQYIWRLEPEIVSRDIKILLYWCKSVGYHALTTLGVPQLDEVCKSVIGALSTRYHPNLRGLLHWTLPTEDKSDCSCKCTTAARLRSWCY
jgi:hypothetical protein